MNVELMLLTVLQGLRTQILDAGMLFFTHLGDAGFIWAALTAVLLVLMLWNSLQQEMLRFLLWR
jgi:hypothetical protein